MRSIRFSHAPRHVSARIPFRTVRAAALLAISIAVLGTSGCHWFSKDRKKDYYAMSEADRPLEFPPALSQADVERGSGNTASGSVSRSSLATQASTHVVSFVVPGDRADVFARVGDALAKVQGVNIASRAQLLGAYDIDYRNEKFLIRVSDGTNGTLVSAVDPRGVAADTDAAASVIAQLKAALVR